MCCCPHQQDELSDEIYKHLQAVMQPDAYANQRSAQAVSGGSNSRLHVHRVCIVCALCVHCVCIVCALCVFCVCVRHALCVLVLV